MAYVPQLAVKVITESSKNFTIIILVYERYSASTCFGAIDLFEEHRLIICEISQNLNSTSQFLIILQVQINMFNKKYAIDDFCFSVHHISRDIMSACSMLGGQ